LNKRFNTSVRLEDIAKELKISIATVSRGLSNSPRVTSETKRKILDAAKKMGYRPNQIAKSLSSGKTYSIGVIIPRYDEPFFIEVCRGIDHYARKHDYKILISSSRNSFKYEAENIAAFESGTVDGIILCFTHETKSFKHIQQIIDKNIPLVLFDNINKIIEGAGHVMIDDFKAAYSAVKILLSRNSSVGFISGVSKKSVFNHRFKGFEKAHDDCLQDYDPKHILNCKSIYQEHEYYEIYNFLSKLETIPESFFCSTDNYAMLCIKSLTKLGYQIPEDVEVIGFGNLHYSSLFTPELTCVSQPSFKMGEKAAELLISKIQNGHYLPNNDNKVVLETKLINRETTV